MFTKLTQRTGDIIVVNTKVLNLLLSRWILHNKTKVAKATPSNPHASTAFRSAAFTVFQIFIYCSIIICTVKEKISNNKWAAKREEVSAQFPWIDPSPIVLLQRRVRDKQAIDPVHKPCESQDNSRMPGSSTEICVPSCLLWVSSKFPSQWQWYDSNRTKL